jgi:hypothetical protein
MLDGAGDHRAATRDRVHILDAQEERRIDHALRQRNSRTMASPSY